MPTQRAKFVILCALCSVLCSCSDPPLLELVITTPEGADPFTGADSVRLSVSAPATRQVTKISDPARFDLELELEVASAAGTITLEALAGTNLLARGETPPMILRPEEQQVSLLVGKAGAFSLLRPRLPAATSQLVSVLLPGQGVLLAGGVDTSGVAQARVSLYDFFQHKLLTRAPLPAARAGAVGAYCGATCGVLALGGDAKALATTLLRFDGARWSTFKDNLDPASRRRGAGLAYLDSTSYLVVGGSNAAGPLDTFLVLKPGTESSPPSLKALPGRARAARSSPALAPGTGSVVIAGGQAAGQPACEVYFRSSGSSQPVTLPGASLASGAAAVDLKDGSVAIIGGTDSAGKLLRDAWIVVPSTLKVTHVANALAAGRTGHEVVRVGQRLVLVGGFIDSGAAATTAEVLAADSLLSVSQPATQRARGDGLTVQRMGQGSLLLAGGSDGKKAQDTLELYETGTLLQ